MIQCPTPSEVLQPIAFKIYSDGFALGNILVRTYSCLYDIRWI